MKKLLLVASVLAAGVLLMPDSAAAQQPRANGGWWDWAWPTASQNAGNSRGGSPAFCRSGQGHPVHGRQWCVQKGFGLGSGPVWRRASWEDVIFRGPSRNRGRGTLRERDLVDILGDVVLGRLASESRARGSRGPLTGRWIQPQRGAVVLQLRAGDVPLAELTDLNGNGRVDAVLLQGAL